MHLVRRDRQGIMTKLHAAMAVMEVTDAWFPTRLGE